jgi:hypothetical protein
LNFGVTTEPKQKEPMMSRSCFIYASIMLCVALCRISRGDSEMDALRSSLAQATKISTTEPSGPSDCTFMMVSQSPKLLGVIEKHGPEISFLVCDGRGSGIAFSRGHDSVSTDYRERGEVIVSRHSNWLFRVSGGETEQISFGPVSSSDRVHFGLCWDPASLLTLMARDATNLEHDAACASYLMQIKHDEFAFDLKPVSDQLKTVTYIDCYGSSGAATAMYLGDTILADLDFSRLDVLGIARSTGIATKEIGGDEYAGLAKFDDSGSKNSAQLVVASALTRALPTAACLAEWMCAKESIRLHDVAALAMEYVKNDPERAGEIKDAVESCKGRLRELANRVAKGNLSLSDGQSEYRKETDATIAVSSILPLEVRPSFCIRFLALIPPAQACRLDRDILRSVLTVLVNRRAELSIQAKAAMMCLTESQNFDVLGDDYFGMRLNEGQLRQRVKEIGNEVQTALDRMNLSVADYAAIQSRWEEIKNNDHQGSVRD